MSHDAPPPFDFDVIPGAYADVRGFQKPQWDVIGDWIASTVPPEERDEAWWSAEWWAFERVAGEFAPAGRWLNSEHVSLMTTQPDGEAQRLLQMIEERWDVIRALLHWPRKDAPGVTVLQIADRATFFRYINADDDGERDALAFEFGDPGQHLAIGPMDAEDLLWSLNDGIASMLSDYRPWPTWLSQAMSMLAQEAPKVSPFDLDEITDHSIARMRLLWSTDTIQEFWIGDSFGQPDDRSHCSLVLAEALGKLILSCPAAATRAFLHAAEWQDAGAAASKAHLGLSLTDLVARVLGAGQWEPAPQAWPPADHNED